MFPSCTEPATPLDVFAAAFHTTVHQLHTLLIYNKLQCYSPHLRQLSRYSDRLRSGGVRGLKTGGGEILCTRPDQPWGPPSLLYNGLFPGGKATGVWRWPHTPSSSDVKERVRPVRWADNLTTFVCRLSWNLGASTCWNSQCLSRPVMGLLYL